MQYNVKDTQKKYTNMNEMAIRIHLDSGLS